MVSYDVTELITSQSIRSMKRSLSTTVYNLYKCLLYQRERQDTVKSEIINLCMYKNWKLVEIKSTRRHGNL